MFLREETGFERRDLYLPYLFADQFDEIMGHEKFRNWLPDIKTDEDGVRWQRITPVFCQVLDFSRVESVQVE